MHTEVHIYAFSVAANVLLSFFPFLIVMLSLPRQVFGEQTLEKARGASSIDRQQRLGPNWLIPGLQGFAISLASSSGSMALYSRDLSRLVDCLPRRLARIGAI